MHPSLVYLSWFCLSGVVVSSRYTTNSTTINTPTSTPSTTETLTTYTTVTTCPVTFTHSTGSSYGLYTTLTTSTITITSCVHGCYSTTSSTETLNTGSPNPYLPGPSTHPSPNNTMTGTGSVEEGHALPTSTRLFSMTSSAVGTGTGGA